MGEQGFRIGAFTDGEARYMGLIVEDVVTPFQDLGIAGMDGRTSLRSLLGRWSDAFDELARVAAHVRPGQGHSLETLAVEPPLPDPVQLFCCGANYARHVIQMMLATNVHPGLAGLDEAGRQAFAQEVVAAQARDSDPYIFMKSITSITGPHAKVDLPEFTAKVDWEVELAVVFGRDAYRETRGSAMSSVAGYLLVNDMTARDRVRRTDPGSIGADWVAGKGAPGFLPMGPWFVPAAFVQDPHDLPLRLWVNGELKQDSNTREMTFDIPRQIEFLTRFVRLLPGDILCTGTPEGNAIATGSWLKNGDVVEAEIPGFGRQRITCHAAAGTS